MYLIGLDIGTSGCKAALFAKDGTLIASASREYDILIPQPTWAEQDAEQVWQSARAVLMQIAPQATREAAMSLSVQGEAVIPVDSDGRALRHAILGMDTRTNAQNLWLREQRDSLWLYQQTGMPIHTINTLPKLLWLKEHEPGIWHEAARFLLYEDFLISKLTGRSVISQCLASRTQLFDLHSQTWSVSLLDLLELDPSRLSDIVPSGHAVGRMTQSLADELGFAMPPLIVSGGHDQACAALGVGLTQAGLAMVSTGTAEVVEVAMNTLDLNTRLYKGNISIYQHVIPDLYLAMTLNHSGGLLLRWFRDAFCEQEVETAYVKNMDPYDLLLEGLSSDPSPLLLLPHLAGSGTPLFDTTSKGAVLGLTFGTTKADFIKAILEGLCFELRTNLDVLRESGIAITQLRAIGGGARSDTWLQLKADITQTQVVAPSQTDAACWGAALLAGAGGECFDLVEAVTHNVRSQRIFEPDPLRTQAFNARYSLYEMIYPALRLISGQM